MNSTATKQLIKDGVPRVIANALTANSHNYYMQDQGSGSAAIDAEKEWLRCRKVMVKWFKSQRAQQQKLKDHLASMVESYQMTQRPDSPLGDIAKGVVRGAFVTTVVLPMRKKS